MIRRPKLRDTLVRSHAIKAASYLSIGVTAVYAIVTVMGMTHIHRVVDVINPPGAGLPVRGIL